MSTIHSNKARVLAALASLLSASSAWAVLVWGEGNWGEPWAGVGEVATSPPEQLSAWQFSAGNPESNASFGIGLTRNNGSTYVTEASVTETVRILGFIRPEAQHIGQVVDIFVVDRVNLAFTMKTADGVFIPWNTKVPELVPYIEDVTLGDNHAVDIFTGKLGIAGDHRIFLGYLPADGILRYTPVPLFLTITE